MMPHSWAERSPCLEVMEVDFPSLQETLGCSTGDTLHGGPAVNEDTGFKVVLSKAKAKEKSKSSGSTQSQTLPAHGSSQVKGASQKPIATAKGSKRKTKTREVRGVPSTAKVASKTVSSKSVVVPASAGVPVVPSQDGVLRSTSETSDQVSAPGVWGKSSFAKIVRRWAPGADAAQHTGCFFTVEALNAGVPDNLKAPKPSTLNGSIRRTRTAQFVVPETAPFKEVEEGFSKVVGPAEVTHITPYGPGRFQIGFHSVEVRRRFCDQGFEVGGVHITPTAIAEDVQTVHCRFLPAELDIKVVRLVLRQYGTVRSVVREKVPGFPQYYSGRIRVLMEVKKEIPNVVYVEGSPSCFRTRVSKGFVGDASNLGTRQRSVVRWSALIAAANGIPPIGVSNPVGCAKGLTMSVPNAANRTPTAWQRGRLTPRWLPQTTSLLLPLMWRFLHPPTLLLLSRSPPTQE